MVAAVAGNLARRLSSLREPVLRRSPMVREQPEASWRLISTTRSGVNAIARGDLTEKITADHGGTSRSQTTPTHGRCLRGWWSDGTRPESITVTRSRKSLLATPTCRRVPKSGPAARKKPPARWSSSTPPVRQEPRTPARRNLASSSNGWRARAGRWSIGWSDHGLPIQDNAKKIADIIGVIDSIASRPTSWRSNRGGRGRPPAKQGRGFAVVASEQVQPCPAQRPGRPRDQGAHRADSVDKVEDGARPGERSRPVPWKKWWPTSSACRCW